MATITEIQDRLGLYKEAERKILEGNQSWEIGGNRFFRPDLPAISRMITRLEMQLATAKQGGALSHASIVFGGRR